MHLVDANVIAVEPRRVSLAEWAIVAFMFLYASIPLILLSTVTALFSRWMWWVFIISSVCALYVPLRILWLACSRTQLALADGEVAVRGAIAGFSWTRRRLRTERVRSIEIAGRKRDPESNVRKVVARFASGRSRTLLTERCRRHAIEHASRIAAVLGVPVNDVAPIGSPVPPQVGSTECCEIISEPARTVLILKPDARSKRGSRWYVVLVVWFAGSLVLMVWMMKVTPGFMLYMPLLMAAMSAGLLWYAVKRWLAEPTREWRITIDAQTTVIDDVSVFGSRVREFDTRRFAGAHPPYLKQSAPKRPLGSVTVFARGTRPFRFMTECDRQTAVHAAAAINSAFHRHLS